jgi:hypothetical protein
MKSFTENGTTYTTTKIEIKGNIYSVMVVKGKFNYINVSKLTNNPFRTIGKNFNNFDEAVLNYKSAEMKIELLKIECNIN